MKGFAVMTEEVSNGTVLKDNSEHLGYYYPNRCYRPEVNGLPFTDDLDYIRSLHGVNPLKPDLWYYMVETCEDAVIVKGHPEQEYFTNRLTVVRPCDGLWYNETGSEYHFVEGKLHRVDGPAVVCKRTGSWDSVEYWHHGKLANMPDELPSYTSSRKKIWTHNGVPHRDNDLPAIQMQDGEERWYKHGVLHRGPNKPAVKGINTRYYVNGVEYYNGKPDTRKMVARCSSNSDLIMECRLFAELPTRCPSSADNK